MNRNGLFIALGLSLTIGLLFGIFPELDLKLAALFYDAASTSFPVKQSGLAAFARDGAMWVAWLAAKGVTSLAVPRQRQLPASA